jgi:hypothetical protein
MIEPDDSITIPEEERSSDNVISNASSVRWTAFGFLLTALVLGGLLYKVVWNSGMGRTSLLFIGIPVTLAVILLFAPRPKSTTGNILRGMALALLLVAPVVGEGYVCILFTAPLFLVVGLIIGVIADSYRKSRSTTASCIVLVFLPLILEGTVPQLTWNRTVSTQATRIVDASQSQVEAALASSPHIATRLPAFLRIGFPRPLEAHGSGLALGATRTIHFSGAEGDPAGDLVMRVTEARPGFVRFDTVSDASKLTQWIGWQSSEVTYTPVDATHTSVTWRITFNRQLDPYWYFTPWEKLAVHQAAGYLIQANATPQE